MKYTTFFLLLFFPLIFACNRQPAEVIVIDPLEVATSSEKEVKDIEYTPLRVAVSAILSPKETYGLYEEVFRYISDKMEMPVEFHQRKTYAEINHMLEAGQLDFAFICSGAYIELDPEKGVDILVVPVSDGKPAYKAYIIVPENSLAQKLEDLRNSRFAFTDPMSNTGYLYALYRLKEFEETPENFFGNTLFTYGHDISIQMVAKGMVDGATIDHLVFEYLRAREPERIKGIKIIEVSEDFGIPPVVASPRLDKDNRHRILHLFKEMHKDDSINKLLDELLIEKFIEGQDENYNSIRKMKNRLAD